MNDHDQNRAPLGDLHSLARIQPNDEATARAIDRARAAVMSVTTAPNATVNTLPRRRTRRLVRFAAAVAAVFIVALVAERWLPYRTGRGLAFAEVQQQLEKTKSVQYLKQRTVRMHGETKPFQLETRKVCILGSHQMREEINRTLAVRGPSEYVTIQNLRTGKLINLYPDKKQYDIPREVLRLSYSTTRPERYARRRPIPPRGEIPAGEVEKLPGRRIDGRMTEGFRLTKQIARGEER